MLFASLIGLSSVIYMAHGRTFVHKSDDFILVEGTAREQFDYFQAQAECQRRFGTDLASIHDIEDVAEIDMLWRRTGYPVGAQNQRIWIGGNDRANEGQYVWEDGTPFDYTDWYPGEPNDVALGEDCIELNRFNAWKWNDTPCISDDHPHFICNNKCSKKCRSRSCNRSPDAECSAGVLVDPLGCMDKDECSEVNCKSCGTTSRCTQVCKDYKLTRPNNAELQGIDCAGACRAVNARFKCFARCVN